jgi:hypothetical protein
MIATVPNSIARTLLADASRVFLRRNWLILSLLVVAVCTGATLAAARVAEARLIMAGIALYAPLVAGFITMSGIVGDERQSGFIVMWFQKPALISGIYALRYGLQVAFLLLFVLALGAMLIGVSALTDIFTLGKALRFSLAMIPLALIPAAMVFAASAWGARRDSTVTFLLIVVGITLAALKATDEAVASRVIKFLAFPINSIMAIVGAPGYPTQLSRPIAILVAQFAIWTLIGLIGLRRTERLLRL